MKRDQRKFYKFLARKTQREIWQAELTMNIIKHLTLAFSTQRLKLLEEKEAKWTAKDAIASGIKEDKVAEELKKLKHEIALEGNMVKAANQRIEELIKTIREADGQLKFIQFVIDGKIS